MKSGYSYAMLGFIMGIYILVMQIGCEVQEINKKMGPLPKVEVEK